jgi:hypothetical protein
MKRKFNRVQCNTLPKCWECGTGKGWDAKASLQWSATMKTIAIQDWLAFEIH